MTEDEPRTDAAEEELDRGSDAGNPWAKTSSGDADEISNDDA
jgi:hypothetical protein